MTPSITFLGFKDDYAGFNVEGVIYAYLLPPDKHHALSVIIKKSGLKALNYAKEHAIREGKQDA